MIYNGREIEFPAITQMSFFKLVETLEKQVNGEDKAAANYARALLEEVEKYPELRDGITDYGQLEPYRESINMMARAMFPDTLTTNEIKILTPPFYFEPVYSSARFDSIVEASGEPFEFNMKDVDDDTFYLYCCYYILGHYFGFSVSGSTPQFLEFFNKNQNLIRTYKMLINAELSEFIPTEKAVQITRDDFEELIDNFDDIELWKSKFPPNSWIMRGVNIVNLVDVTFDQTVEEITSNLLVKTTDTFAKIESGLRKLLNNNDLRIGVMSLEKDRLIPMDVEDLKSVIIGRGEYLCCDSDLCERTISLLTKKFEPLIITDAERFHKRINTTLSRKILDSGFKSYIIAPILNEGDFLGYLEIGAKEKYQLHQGSLRILNEVIPILSTAQKRFKTEAQNRVEAVIQQECTTIHPSVKWRFEEEAERFIKEESEGRETEFGDIVFDNLYPLYGQIDIKGSSERRNHAVSADLIKQLTAVKKVLDQAFLSTKMPAYEELIFRTNSYMLELEKELAAGSEHKILSFLKADIYPVFEYLKNEGDSLHGLIEQYESILNPDLETVYEERKKYDDSVNLINHRLAHFLDKREAEAQAMFPHYFERYKTDGVEYNIYIGQSIEREKTFDLIHLRNMRLWQLIVMCEMENEFRQVQKELETDIEVASLMLVYNTPLSINFRMDEKQFDVEGAYNARYEIIKKRVDKAHIKGTNERITQPGHVVIVYSQDQDAQEYRAYLNFLVAKGCLKEGYEDLELEDLQGVHGLRAFRAAVDYAGGLTVDEFILEMERTNN